MIKAFNWRSELNLIEADAIGDDIILLENPIVSSAFDYPFKVDVVTGIICTKGTMKGSLNLKKYTAQAPCFYIVLPDQILEFEKFSEDFEGHFVVLSKKFADRLIAQNLQDKVPLLRSVMDNPWTPLSEQELDAMLYFYKVMQMTIRMKDNPRRIEILTLLIQAFFMGISHQFHKIPEDSKKSKQEILIESFINCVHKNYKQHRNTEFYADKLSLTPKYLSKIIKDNTGQSATEWINNYVILEAKALLKSSDMTIQQISNELNFPTQSFFGKYFKRHVGVSPKGYKYE
ncbi:helix-turn-helix domain-containing protein [Saccharicrinis sp. FJH2]|uniref:helix-turn-helix domain-containing protein n=1 Tax=Saccharicrinis sp. FJH65 TaxID=3344659 RepID=UPI0035F4F3DD